ncbi:MAG: hypothetical protein R2867_26105 [Caldilineaceae bacterium]
MADYRAQYGDRALLLMAIQNKEVVVATTEAPLAPQQGWELVSLVPANGHSIP